MVVYLARMQSGIFS